jgi:hypothetical protein
MKAHVWAIVQRAGLEEALGSDHFHPSVQSGVDAFLAEQPASSEA